MAWKSRLVADHDRLIQVVVNFLSNAIKFSTRGQHVRVCVKVSDAIIEVSVVDQGRGVPAGYEKLIFEPYRQVELSDGGEKKGTGLGLAICKSIVEQHGGTIGVVSEQGKGSSFWFRLPRISQVGGTDCPSNEDG